MSDRTHKILAAVLGVVFVTLAALMQSPLLEGHATAHHLVELAMSVLGALGFGVTRPVLAKAQPAPLVASAVEKAQSER